MRRLGVLLALSLVTVLCLAGAALSWTGGNEAASAAMTGTTSPVTQDIDIAPRDATGLVGQSQRWTVTVTDDGEPAEDEDVTFVARMGRDTTVHLDATTDHDGIAHLTHVRTVAGVDSITAEAYGGLESTSTTYTWTEPPLTVELSTSGASGQVGTPLTWTATVTAGGVPVPDASVRFLGQLAGSPDEDVTLATGASGQVSHQHTRAVPGEEQLQVIATTMDKRSAFDMDTFSWLPTPDAAIALAPANSTGDIGTHFGWTATVTQDGQPIPGVTVEFLGKLPGQPDEQAQDVTGADGVARHTHTRLTPGTESLRVSATVNARNVSDTSTRTWAQPPPLLLVALQPKTSSGEVGTDFAWTATVTQDGEPVAGATVSFLGQFAGEPDEAEQVATGADGVATHTHTRSAAGTEDLAVTVTVDDRTASDTGTRTWIEPEPSRLGVELKPGESTGMVGENFTWTATVTLNGEPVAGAPVDFLGELPGETPETAAGVLTDGSGMARHTHTRTVPGTERLTVSTSWAGQIGTDTGERSWRDPTDPPTTSDGPSTPEPPDGDPDEDPPTRIPPIDPLDPPPPDAHDLGPVDLGRNSAIPGGDLAVSGRGCEPGASVEVFLAGEVVGRTTADETGAFTVRAPVPTVPLGQYVVRVRCGDGVAEILVDLVSTVASSTAPSAAASAAAVLSFFVLLGASLTRGVTGAGPGPVGS